MDDSDPGADRGVSNPRISCGPGDSGIPSWGPDILLRRRTGNENARDANRSGNYFLEVTDESNGRVFAYQYADLLY